MAPRLASRVLNNKACAVPVKGEERMMFVVQLSHNLTVIVANVATQIVGRCYDV